MSGIVLPLHHNGAYSRCYPHFISVSLDLFLLQPNQIAHQALLILLQEFRLALSLMTTIITSILSSLDHSRSFHLVSLFPSGLPEICTPQSCLSYSNTTLFKPPNSALRIKSSILPGASFALLHDPTSPASSPTPHPLHPGHTGFPFYPSNAP